MLVGAHRPHSMKLNQREGFDYPACAWPETPGHRKHAEFCENEVKTVAEKATARTVTPEFFATHSVAELLGRTEFWLGQQRRHTHPMVWTHTLVIWGSVRVLASPCGSDARASITSIKQIMSTPCSK